MQGNRSLAALAGSGEEGNIEESSKITVIISEKVSRQKMGRDRNEEEIKRNNHNKMISHMMKYENLPSKHK